MPWDHGLAGLARTIKYLEPERLANNRLKSNLLESEDLLLTRMPWDHGLAVLRAQLSIWILKD